MITWHIINNRRNLMNHLTNEGILAFIYAWMELDGLDRNDFLIKFPKKHHGFGKNVHISPLIYG